MMRFFKYYKIFALFLILGAFSFFIGYSNLYKVEKAIACNPPTCATCASLLVPCGGNGSCSCQSNHETPITIDHITKEFIQHREWLIKIVWEAHVLPAMLLMTEQISALAVHQMMIVGTFFDAKHQLETQRMLQELQNEAHKNYSVSESMCEIGTSMRSLAASNRNVDLAQIAIATRASQRQLLSGDSLSSGSERDDLRSRLTHYRETYCSKSEFGNGFEKFCKSEKLERQHRDIHYTDTMDLSKTLKIDFAKPEAAPDEEDVLALSNNLYGHQILPRIPEDKMAREDGTPIDAGAYVFMKTRSLTAKRSVAQASFAAQAAQRAEGEASVQPYLKAILEEMGLKERDIKDILGERPSYYTQMEFLSKRLYQTPNFYANLYDKPANIDRKIVAMQAIALMQRRDMARSALRAEMNTAVLLEARLREIQDEFVNESNPFRGDTKALELP